MNFKWVLGGHRKVQADCLLLERSYRNMGCGKFSHPLNVSVDRIASFYMRSFYILLIETCLRNPKKLLINKKEMAANYMDCVCLSVCRCSTLRAG